MGDRIRVLAAEWHDYAIQLYILDSWVTIARYFAASPEEAISLVTATEWALGFTEMRLEQKCENEEIAQLCDT